MSVVRAFVILFRKYRLHRALLLKIGIGPPIKAERANAVLMHL
jgi:hypothetical protein